MRVVLGPYQPDLPDLVNAKGLTKATNAIPIMGGYGPQKDLVSLAYGALTAFCRGAISAIDTGGNAFNFAGDATKLYKVSSAGGAADVTRPSGAYSAGDAQYWEAAQFANVVFFVHDRDELQYYDLRGSTTFDNVKDLDGGEFAPRARHMAVVGNHLVLGNVVDIIDGHRPDVVQWCSINAPLKWPEPGSDLAISTQSDRSPLEGDGGWITAISAGPEIGGIFQERAVHRMEYRGGDIIYQIDRVEMEHGCLVPGLVCPFGREVFYLSESGFRLFDYTTSIPIGEERVNRTFFADLDTTYLHRVSCERDPDRPLIYVLYAGAGNTAGLPNRMLIYNYELQRFATVEIEMQRLSSAGVLTSTLSLDDYPDTPDLDDPAFPLASLDDRQSPAGARTLGGYDSASQLSTFTGDALCATFETGAVEHNPGFRTFVSKVRPLVRGGTASIAVAPIGRLSDSDKFGKPRRQERDGSCPARANGRYHKYRMQLDFGFDDAVGMDVVERPAGRS